MRKAHPIGRLTLKPRPMVSNKARTAGLIGSWGKGGGDGVRLKAAQIKETYGLTVSPSISPYRRARVHAYEERGVRTVIS